MRAIFATWLAAWRETRSKPKALILDVTIMILNNFTWIVLWGFVFHNTGSIRGWDLHRFLLLFSLITTPFGIAYGLFYNCRRLSRLINDGSLDAALTLPVDTFSYLLVRRIHAPQIGDIVFGIAVFLIAVQPTLAQALVFTVVVLLGATIYVSFVAFLGALTLHFGGRGEAQDIGFEALSLFSFYPIDMFGGVAKLVMYTVVPAAFATAIPAELVNEFRPVQLLWLVCAAVFFAVLARVTFTTGLRKYRSGSRWTAA